jgi:hypothetical protein
VVGGGDNPLSLSLSLGVNEEGKPLPCGEGGSSKAKGENPKIKSACLEAKVAAPPPR